MLTHLTKTPSQLAQMYLAVCGPQIPRSNNQVCPLWIFTGSCFFFAFTILFLPNVDILHAIQNTSVTLDFVQHVNQWYTLHYQ